MLTEGKKYQGVVNGLNDKRMKIFWILMAMGVLLSCNERTAETKNSVEAELQVKTVPVVRVDMVDTVWIYGDVRLRWEAQLASQFDGRLTEFTLLTGDHVKLGQKIATIIPPAREALLQIEGQMDPKVRPLLERQIKSIALYSPIDGIVLDMWHHNGDVVQKGEQIIHIGDLRILDVIGDLPVRYVPVLVKKKYVNVTFPDFPGKTLYLKIEAISGKVDEKKQTVGVRCGLENRKGMFRPGMRVRISFPGATHAKTLIIPRPALLEEEGVFSAFVFEDGHAVKRRLELGIVGGDKVEVLSGVNENEQVITVKTYSLTDGMKVITE